MLTSSLTEARKQAQAEEEYYKTLEQQQGGTDQRHDSKVSAIPPDISAFEPVSDSASSTLRATSPITDLDDLNTVIARISTKRRGSDDSLKTVYTEDDTVPELAYRSRPALRSGLLARHASSTASLLDEEDLISTFTDY